MSTRKQELVEYEHANLEDFETFLTHMEKQGWTNYHFIMEVKGKRTHPWESRITGDYCFSANGKRGDTLKLKRGQRYFFTFKSTQHSLYFTVDPLGGPEGIILPHTGEPFQSFKTVSFVVNQSFPVLFYYQDRGSPYLGGAIVVYEAEIKIPNQPPSRTRDSHQRDSKARAPQDVISVPPHRAKQTRIHYQPKTEKTGKTGKKITLSLSVDEQVALENEQRQLWTEIKGEKKLAREKAREKAEKAEKGKAEKAPLIEPEIELQESHSSQRVEGEPDFRTYQKKLLGNPAKEDDSDSDSERLKEIFSHS